MKQASILRLVALILTAVLTWAQAQPWFPVEIDKALVAEIIAVIALIGGLSYGSQVRDSVKRRR